MITAKLIPIEKVTNDMDVRGQHMLGAILYEHVTETQQPFEKSRFTFPVATVHLFDPEAIEHCTVESERSTEDSMGIAEMWLTESKPVYLSSGGWSIAKTENLLFATISFPDNGKNITETTQMHYANLFNLLEESGFSQLLRMWNYMPDINGSDGNDLERYRSFCLGRSLAFSKHYSDNNKMMPAATGVGSLSGEITVVVLAQPHSENVVHLENPRQTPAYEYPSIYGPRAPSFARATNVSMGNSKELLFVSGTASIVNSETVHKGDCEEQLEETFRNIASLISDDNLKNHGLTEGYTVKDLNQIKVYYRHKSDLPLIKKSCSRYFSSEAESVYLYSEICRSDLDVEIEGFVSKRKMIDGKPTEFRQQVADSQV